MSKSNNRFRTRRDQQSRIIHAGTNGSYMSENYVRNTDSIGRTRKTIESAIESCLNIFEIEFTNRNAHLKKHK